MPRCLHALQALAKVHFTELISPLDISSRQQNRDYILHIITWPLLGPDSKTSSCHILFLIYRTPSKISFVLFSCPSGPERRMLTFHPRLWHRKQRVTVRICFIFLSGSLLRNGHGCDIKLGLAGILPVPD